MEKQALYHYCERRRRAMWESRQGYDADDREIAQSVYPELATGYEETIADLGTKARANDKRLIHPCSIQAIDTCAAGMQNNITSPARPWFRYGLSAKPDGSPTTTPWLDAASAIVQELLDGCGAFQSFQEAYLHLIVFGRACLISQMDLKTVMRFTTLVPGTYAFGFTGSGDVKSVVRGYSMTPEQLVAEFGKEVLSDDLIQAAEKGVNRKWTCWQLIEPNTDDDGKPVDQVASELPNISQHRYRSIHWLGSGSAGRNSPASGRAQDGILRISGFPINPIIAPRYATSGGNWYGSGIGKKILGTVKGLQAVEKDSLRGIARLVNPPVNAPTSMKSVRVNLNPGGVNWYESGSAGTESLVKPIFQSPCDLNPALQKEQTFERIIQDMCFNSLFLTLQTVRDRQKTATEVEQMIREGMEQLGPVVTRMNKEMLRPIVMSAFWYAWEAGVFGEEVPDYVSSMSVYYISNVQQAMKATKMNSVQAFWQMLTAGESVAPGMKDWVDPDGAYAELADMLMIPARMTRPKRAVDQIRQQQAEAAMAAQQAQVAQMQADAASKLGKVPTGNTVAGRILGEG